ncbi:MAG: undecaprenyldiphospho-muramoylpentapeptide beta-N-acetylglucosaminyltransferase [Fimbriimonadales bacterium]
MPLRLIVTGGGTGGHVFPALEVARLAREQGIEVLYFGSLRGQEGRACERAGIPFQGFPSRPIYSLKTPRGWAGIFWLARSRSLASRELRRAKPSVLFSTGGYSSAPVVSAARGLGLPYVIHEQNSVPGRTNKILSRGAKTVAVTFEASLKHFEGHVVRTGMPVRAELRELASQRSLEAEAGHGRMLVMGGSQGSSAINQAALATAQRMTSRNLRWLNVTGKKHFEDVFSSHEKLGIGGIFEMRPFLEGSQMGEEYAKSALVIGRSGTGTLSELAAFRLPSVLVPYPFAYADHQTHNALEFEAIGAAKVVPQPGLTPAALEEAVKSWLDSAESVRNAQESLAKWDRPDAAERILELVRVAAGQSL